jgi:predicted ATPase
MLPLAQSTQDPELLLSAHMQAGVTLNCLGEFTSSQAHIEQVIALYDSQQYRSLSFVHGDGVHAKGVYAAGNLRMLGYPDQALSMSHEALSLAQELAHPFLLAHALYFAAMNHGARREWQVAQERVEAAIALCREHGFQLFLARGSVIQGWLLAEQGQVEEGIAQMQQGIATMRATGAENGRPLCLALLARAYGKAGKAAEGFTLLAEALDLVNKTGARVSEVELYRLKGELTLAQSRHNDFRGQ